MNKHHTRNFSRSIRKKGRRLLNEIKKDPRHLFLLSPPFSGSTAITQLIRTSPNVTVFPGRGEGQHLPEAKNILLVDQRWNPNLKVNWERIRKIFLSYWSPLKPIRFEKSPPHIVRAAELEQLFENAYFLITLRNPYAQIEGLLRRRIPFNNYGPQTTPSPSPTPRDAAEFWVRTARFQKYNMEQLKNSCFFSYEELTKKTDETISIILEFLPDISNVDIEAEFTARNVTGKPIKGFKNLNQQKIDRLSSRQLKEVNSILCQHQDILHFFKYQMIA